MGVRSPASQGGACNLDIRGKTDRAESGGCGSSGADGLVTRLFACAVHTSELVV